MAEVKFMRALYYFYLVHLWCAPKITTVQSGGRAASISCPGKEIYDEIIIPDLLEAEQSIWLLAIIQGVSRWER